MLSVSIFVLVGVIIATTFFSGMRLNEQMGEGAQWHRQGGMATDLIATELENMVEYDFSLSFPEKVAFVAHADQIQFLLRTSTGIKVVRYYLEAEEQSLKRATRIGQRTRKNVDVDVVSMGEPRGMYKMMRSEQNLSAYVQDLKAESNEIEIIATNLAADGLKFRYKFPDATGMNQASGVPGVKASTPNQIRIELSFVDVETESGQQVFSKNIIIPRYFMSG